MASLRHFGAGGVRDRGVKDMRWPPFSSRQTARHRPRPRSAVEEVGENHRRTGELARALPHRGTRPADPRPLRPFPSAMPLHPSLYEKRERSEGRRSAVEGKRRGRRSGAATSCPAACQRQGPGSGPGQGPRPRAGQRRRPGPGPTSHRAVAPGRRAGPWAVTPGPAAPPASRPHPPAPPTTRPIRARPHTGACRPRCRRRAPRSRAPAPRTRTPRPARRSR